MGLPIHCTAGIVTTCRRLFPLVAPRVQWAFLRLMCNGWFTARRMQTKKPCVFCRCFDCSDPDPQHHVRDALEHYFRCPAIRRALGPAFHGLDLQFWFLIRGSVRFKLAWLHVIGSLYNWHNILRHKPYLKFTKKGLWHEASYLKRGLKTKKSKIPFDLRVFQVQGLLY